MGTTVSCVSGIVAPVQGGPCPAGEPLGEGILNRLAKAVGSRRFQMWFDRSTHLTLDRAAGRLDVAVPNRFVQDWIGRHFTQDLREAAEKEFGAGVEVRLRIDHDRFAGASRGGEAVGVGEDRRGLIGVGDTRGVSGLRGRDARNAYERFSLDRFVVGPSSELAYAAALQLADQADGGGAGLLFIHGGCGLGKTHLLHGVCGRVLRHRPRARVRYYSAEQFTNEFLTAVRANKVEGFRNKIRKLDLLAVDDVHFIANKQATQQEFLHSFDAIELGGARLVLASDSHPKQIAQFSEALISRCMRGMVAQVQRPDAATRSKIVRSLADRRGVDVTDQAVRVIAERCVGSIRDIEGALSKLQALASLSMGSGGGLPASPTSPGGAEPRCRIDRGLAERLFGSEPVMRRRKPVRYEAVVQAVCDHFSVNRAAISGRSRHRHVVLARAITAYLTRRLTTMSYPEIGAAMGRPTHSTVITAVKRVERQMRGGTTFVHPVSGQEASVSECVSEITDAIDRGS